MSAVAPPPARERPAPAPAAAPLAAPVVAAPARAPAPAGGRDRSALVRTAAVAALALFVAGHWSALVADPAGGRAALVALLAALLGAGIAASARLPGPWPLRAAVRGGALVAAFAAGLALAGLDGDLIAPGGWGDLASGLDEGLGALRDSDWPYAGLDPWGRLALLLGLPAFVIPGAALACWPGRRAGAVARAAGVALLVGAYTVAVTNVDFDGELGRGAALAALLAVWLAPVRLARRDRALAAATVVAAALVALPVAAALDRDEPWFDYKSWNWFGSPRAATFDWNHAYGPLDWPRDGRTLLEVRSRRPLYWRVATLDRFDGFRWVASRTNADTIAGGELPPRLDPRWIVEDVGFRIRDLSTRRLPVAGTALDVRSARATYTTQDGTVTTLGPPLREGDSYEVDVYVPDPSAARMRMSGRRGWPEQFRQYLRIELPRPGESALDGIGRAGDAVRSTPGPVVVPPFRGEREGAGAAYVAPPGVDHALRASPYAGTYRLARRLADGQRTPYDIVKRIERHLRTSYSYSERPPSHDYPLESFLFEDRAGYCQQFAGAMALMLRMNGIPARVAGGFSPGSFNRDRGEFRVRDLDAHSWVEAYFPLIGWVAFDPTASGAPAASRARPERAASAAGTTDPGRGGVAAERSERGGELPGSPPGGGADGLPGWARLALLAGLAGATGGGLWLRRRRALSRATGVDERAVAELARALRRLGFGVPPAATLLALERRLARAAGPAGAAYARVLREHRYGAAAAPPGAAERRALRRELARRGGLRWRLRCLLALPPGGPGPGSLASGGGPFSRS